MSSLKLWVGKLKREYWNGSDQGIADVEALGETLSIFEWREELPALKKG